MRTPGAASSGALTIFVMRKGCGRWFAAGFTQELHEDGLAVVGRLAGIEEFLPNGVAMVLRWLNSPVVWTLIVLIVSSLGIYRELF